MKTIFLTSFHLLISRNILSTSIPKALARAGVRVIVIVPDYRKEFVERTYGGNGIIVEGVRQNLASQRFLGLLFKRLFRWMLNTNSIRVYESYLIYRWAKPVWYRLLFRCSQWLGKRLWRIRLIRRLDFSFAPRDFFLPLFERYRPDLIFSTDVLNENDVALMQEACRRKIPTLGMVRSWDNLTVLGLMRFLPDHLLVTTEILKEEAVRYNGMTPDRITVVGIPHYDRYMKGPTRSREAFFREIGADPKKKLIFFTPVGDLYLLENDVDRYVLDILAAMDVNVIVRFPPADTVSGLDGFEKPRNMHYDTPGVTYTTGQVGHRDVSPQDDDNLLDGMYWSDLVVTGPSTIAVEAALFDKPTILVNFHRKPKSGLDGIFPYQYDHMEYIVRSGGARLVASAEEFRTWVKRYLTDPTLDRAGRERIRREEVWRTDGTSGERVSAAVLALLAGQRP